MAVAVGLMQGCFSAVLLSVYVQAVCLGKAPSGIMDV